MLIDELIFTQATEFDKKLNKAALAAFQESGNMIDEEKGITGEWLGVHPMQVQRIFAALF